MLKKIGNIVISSVIFSGIVFFLDFYLNKLEYEFTEALIFFLGMGSVLSLIWIQILICSLFYKKIKIIFISISNSLFFLFFTFLAFYLILYLKGNYCMHKAEKEWAENQWLFGYNQCAEEFEIFYSLMSLLVSSIISAYIFLRLKEFTYNKLSPR